ncbi:MAG: V-type ATP synthase subunit D [Caldilineales bacterium]|nr:V-type ATP synthase subunit D [Caldilineales bacterium]
MNGERIVATRSALFQKRSQIGIAQRGKELLRQKRNALMEELLRSTHAALGEVEALAQAAAVARHQLALAVALDGPEVVGSAALAPQEPLTVPVADTRVMGIKVPRIEPQVLTRPADRRSYGPAHNSPRLDTVAAAFESELEILLEVANRELRIRRLAEAIRQTTRRVNALEHILIPRLQQELRQIELTLAEREREDQYRIRRVKTRPRRHDKAGDPTHAHRPTHPYP